MSDKEKNEPTNEAPKAKPIEAPKPNPTSSTEMRPVEKWAVDDPVNRVPARLVRIHKKWGINKMITNAEWKQAAKEVLETPIGFTN